MARSAPVRIFKSYVKGTGFTSDFGGAMNRRVINKTGSDIAVDKLVVISGYDVTSKHPKIVLADADSAGLATDVFVTRSIITNGSKGTVYKGGTSAANLNTNFGTVGDAVYLDTTAGAFTGTVPSANNASVVIVGYTMVKSATVGQIRWDINRRSKISDQDLNSDVKVLAATVTATTNVIAATITGFSWTLQAGGTYKFEVNLPSTMTTNGGLTVSLKYTTATITSIQAQTYAATASDNTTAVSTQSTTATDATKYFDSKTAAYTLVNIKGTLVVNAGGTVAVQFCQNTSHADTTSVLLGAYAQFTRVA